MCSESTLVNTLSGFTPISLPEMDGCAFMNRVDTKFVFPISKLHGLLNALKNHYRVLEINGKRNFPYCSTYLDTPDYYFFNQHLRGIPNRYKVRYRVYEATGVSYLEVKFKHKNNRTLKWRVKNELLGTRLNGDALQFLFGYIQDNANSVAPVLVNRFQRITLVGIRTRERITFDYNISFSDNSNTLIELPYLAIAELKRDGQSGSSPFLSAVKSMMIRPSGFSKYCVGTALLKPIARLNLVKPKIHLLNKIKHDQVICSAG